MVNRALINVVRACFFEIKEQLETELDFSDPKITVLNTIKVEQICSLSEIRPGLSRNRIKTVVEEYIYSYITEKTKISKSSRSADAAFKDKLLSDAGVQKSTTKDSGNTVRVEEVQDEPVPGCFKDTESEMEVDENEEQFDDELEHDPIATDISRKYPALPRTPCPQSLFVGNLSYRYINSLYTTDRSSFPKRWNTIKNSSPENAWHSLNQIMVPFINKRWATQGVHLGTKETPVGTLSYYDLKSSILSAIREQTTKIDSNAGTSQANTNPSGTNSEVTNRLERLTTRLEETTRVLTSYTTKMTGREVANPPSYSVTQPHLMSSSSSSIVPSASKKPRLSESDEEIVLG